jgi:hypothetical protein
MFGRVPVLDEVRGIVREVVETGRPVGEIVEHRAGISQRFEKTVRGHAVWADVFLDRATNTVRLMNGGLK